MWNASASKKYCWLTSFLVLGTPYLISAPAVGGSYRDSAHGNSVYGVNRSAIEQNFLNFAIGNCEHCHDTHASLEGVEPAPPGGPSPHTLFADSFNTSRTQTPYSETDDFCFYCHTGSGPNVINQNYSTTFGGGDTGVAPQSIMAAFNQASYHNLFDIYTFLSSSITYKTWFAERENPCSGCHNPHLAKRNWDSGQPGFPLLSTLSLPGTSTPLWGENETMITAYPSGYEAPYVDVSAGTTREPAGFGNEDGANTPNYVGFCTTCHDPANTIWSTTLNRNLKKINWGETGLNQDKHGALTRNGTDIFREPYAGAAVSKSKNNFVLSCLDCHEPHGSGNIMLLRRRINGENLEGAVVTADVMSYACKRCHADDLAAAAGTGEADRWEYVHHGVPDAPYNKMSCLNCHGGAGGTPIPCGNCHGHGMTDSWVPVQQTGRITF